MLGSRPRSTATLAAYYGSRMRLRDYASLREAVANADAAVMMGGADLAVVRDDHGIMVYAADCHGRTWSPGEHHTAARVADMGRAR